MLPISQNPFPKIIDGNLKTAALAGIGIATVIIAGTWYLSKSENPPLEKSSANIKLLNEKETPPEFAQCYTFIEYITGADGHKCVKLKFKDEYKNEETFKKKLNELGPASEPQPEYIDNFTFQRLDF